MSVCLSVPKYLANHRTDMVLVFYVAFHIVLEVVYLFLGKGTTTLLIEVALRKIVRPPPPLIIF